MGWKDNRWRKYLIFFKDENNVCSRGESAALGHFSVSIFFGQVENKEFKKKFIVASQYNSLALLFGFL